MAAADGERRELYVVGSHEKQAFKNLNELRQYEELLDITLKVEDKEIKAHRIVLAACSPYFRAMLTTGFAESYMTTIIIQDCDADSVQLIIDFFYSRSLKVTQANIEGILASANLFQIPEIVQECAEFMTGEIQLDNCLGIQSLATHFSLLNLQSKVNNFIAWNFMDLCVEEEFALIPGHQLDQIISQDALHVNGEDDVFEALMAWYQEEESRIYNHKGLMKHIRFTCLDPDYIEEVVLEDETFCRVPEWEEMAEEALDKLFSSKTRKAKQILENPRRSPNVLHLIAELFESKVETFNTETGLCSEVPNMKEISGTALVVNDTLYLLIGGGLMVDRYIPSKNLWLRVVDGNKESEYVACGGLDSIFVVGGGKRAKYLDLKTNQWHRLPSMGLRRSYHAAIVLENSVYVAGGATPPGEVATTSTEHYCTENKRWYPCASMTSPRFRHELAVLNNCIYVIGGCDKIGSSIKSVEYYDPKIESWQLVASLIHPRRDFAVGVLEGNIFVFGGVGTTTVERYNSESDKWMEAGSLKKRWCNFRCISFPYIQIKTGKKYKWQDFHDTEK